MKIIAGLYMTNLGLAGLGALSVVVLAGHPALAKDAHYRCQDGTTILARFTEGASGAGAVTLSFGEKPTTLVLQQLLSADGGRYGDKKVEFWVKGKGATFTHDGKGTSCTTP